CLRVDFFHGTRFTVSDEFFTIVVFEHGNQVGVGKIARYAFRFGGWFASIGFGLGVAAFGIEHASLLTCGEGETDHEECQRVSFHRLPSSPKNQDDSMRSSTRPNTSLARPSDSDKLRV